jgi:hypothetical protein
MAISKSNDPLAGSWIGYFVEMATAGRMQGALHVRGAYGRAMATIPTLKVHFGRS